MHTATLVGLPELDLCPAPLSPLSPKVPITNAIPLESIINYAAQQVPEINHGAAATFLEALSNSDVHHIWQLRLLSDHDWAQLGVSIGFRCSISQALSAGEIEVNQSRSGLR